MAAQNLLLCVLVVLLSAVLLTHAAPVKRCDTQLCKLFYALDSNKNGKIEAAVSFGLRLIYTCDHMGFLCNRSEKAIFVSLFLFEEKEKWKDFTEYKRQG